MNKTKWEIFHVLYQTPKFGVENEYLPEKHWFMVSTTKGPEDAADACRKFHPNCNVTDVIKDLKTAEEICQESLKEKSDGTTKGTTGTKV